MLTLNTLIVSLALPLIAIPVSADSFTYVESSNQTGSVFGTLDFSTGAFQ